jgi:hypothetical protein
MPKPYYYKLTYGKMNGNQSPELRISGIGLE